VRNILSLPPLPSPSLHPANCSWMANFKNMLRRPATRLSIQNEDLDELLNVGVAQQQQTAVPQAATTTAARIGLGK